jgi:hypothetical protein
MKACTDSPISAGRQAALFPQAGKEGDLQSKIVGYLTPNPLSIVERGQGGEVNYGEWLGERYN